MAINATDKFEDALFQMVLDVAGITSNTAQISGLRAGVIALEIEATGLDAVVDLKWLQGNTDDITKMSPVIDADTVDIETSITNGDYFLIAEMEGIYLGLELNLLTATAGILTITGRI